MKEVIMGFVIVDDPEQVILLKSQHLCPFCKKRTAYSIGETITEEGPQADKMQTIGDFIGYRCRDNKCNTRDYSVPKAVHDDPHRFHK
jgi:hypothetical protein